MNLPDIYFHTILKYFGVKLAEMYIKTMLFTLLQNKTHLTLTFCKVSLKYFFLTSNIFLTRKVEDFQVKIVGRLIRFPCNKTKWPGKFCFNKKHLSEQFVVKQPVSTLGTSSLQTSKFNCSSIIYFVIKCIKNNCFTKYAFFI